MEKELSSSLMRQLKRSKIDLDGPAVPIEIFREFISRVDTSYEDFKERESRYEQVCRQSSDEISNYISKLKSAEAINKQQQADILNMLRHIKQGIFTIMDQRLIHPEFSVYTTELLEREDLAGRDVAEVLFQRALIDRDMVDQVLSALDFMIGSDDLGFEANQHILPKQLILDFGQGQEKTIEIDWTPIFNDERNVEKILVTLRDVSAIRLLEKVNLDQQKELEVLRQLMSSSPERFEQFHRNAITGLEHCKMLLEKQGINISIGNLQELYRDLHTIKGNARMFGFRGVTNLVHEAEEHYKVSVHVIHESWNTQERLKDLALIRSELDFYASLAEKAFGKHEGPETKQRQHFVEETLRILSGYESRDYTSQEALSLIAQQAQQFEYAPLEYILESVSQGSTHLACELGKIPPQIQIDRTAVGFHRSIHGTLESIFNHLIRNSLDHGIEPESERLKSGKAPRGRIHIALEQHHDQVLIKMKDDGRGLNLQRIVQKAQSLGLLAGRSELPDEQLAQLIFEPGLSTKQQENQVSGRGMGMSAVKTMAQQLGGDLLIEIETMGASTQAVTFILKMPNNRLAALSVQQKSEQRKVS